MTSVGFAADVVIWKTEIFFFFFAPEALSLHWNSKKKKVITSSFLSDSIPQFESHKGFQSQK